MNIHIQTAEIARIANALADMCGDDDRLYSDMLEGQSDLHELIDRLGQSIANDTAMVNANKARMNDIADRNGRFMARIEAARQGIVMLMQAGKVVKVELPEATYSVRDGKPKLTVVSDDAVPAEYQRAKIETDKAAINDAFADAAELPNWLVREPVKPVLTVRTK